MNFSSFFFIFRMFFFGVMLVWLVMWKICVFIVMVSCWKVVLSIMLVVLWLILGRVLRFLWLLGIWLLCFLMRMW